MTTGSHPQQTESEGIHQPFNWVWADSTERLAETITALDINKIGLQQSDNSVWVLTAVTPTWVDIGGAIASGLIQSGGGTDSIIVNGDNGEADGDYSTALGGQDVSALGDYSVASGNGAVAENQGERAHASAFFDGGGDAQHGDIHVIRSVTHSDANWYPLWTDGVSLHPVIAIDVVWTFEVLIVGATANLGKVFSFKIQGCIKNTGGTTALSGTPTVTTISDGDDVSFDARVTADDTNDALAVEVQDSDGAGDVVQWSAVIKYVSVTFSP